jgi:Transglycosylase SLT domain
MILIALSVTQLWGRPSDTGSAKAITMRFELSQAPSPGSVSRVPGFALRLLLLATMAVSGWPALASDVGEDPKPVQQQPSPENGQPEENHDTKQTREPETGAPSTAPGLCDALAATAVANELPVDFFTRLIWQESRFKPDAISRKGAQGIAQFMPPTARSSGLESLRLDSAEPRGIPAEAQNH